MNSIRYQYGNDLDLDQVIDLYNASTLGERRPVDDRQVMSDMLRHANLVVTAWDGSPAQAGGRRSFVFADL